ncbi:amino acid transporter [Brucella sp. IR073]|uniref:amino acid transporter n=1 Tax=unclassified Brucella TaxID=2632610 RepID=UPI003B97DBDA
MTLIHNERIKLLATYFNGIGIAVFAVGGFAPVISSLYSPNGPTPVLIFISLVCILVSFALHYAASNVLRRLEP